MQQEPVTISTSALDIHFPLSQPHKPFPVTLPTLHNLFHQGLNISLVPAISWQICIRILSGIEHIPSCRQQLPVPRRFVRTLSNTSFLCDQAIYMPFGVSPLGPGPTMTFFSQFCCLVAFTPVTGLASWFGRIRRSCKIGERWSNVPHFILVMVVQGIVYLTIRLIAFTVEQIFCSHVRTLLIR